MRPSISSTFRTRLAAAALAAACALGLASAAHAGKPGGADGPWTRIEKGRGFGSQQGREIRAWFADAKNLEGLPPGLGRADLLPPGLGRQLDRNGKLPPGLESRLHSLPDALERLLPDLRDGYRRAVIGRHVLLIDDRAGRIRDMLRDVLPEH